LNLCQNRSFSTHCSPQIRDEQEQANSLRKLR
jgi:hypothetical protein